MDKPQEVMFNPRKTSSGAYSALCCGLIPHLLPMSTPRKALPLPPYGTLPQITSRTGSPSTNSAQQMHPTIKPTTIQPSRLMN